MFPEPAALDRSAGPRSRYWPILPTRRNKVGHCDYLFGMEYRSVNYEVREIEPLRWAWIILPAIGRPVISGDLFLTREKAVEDCIAEINNGIERTRTRAPKD